MESTIQSPSYGFFAGISQQQSEATCRALDSAVTGGSSALGTYIREPSCFKITCVSTTSTNMFTIFPCTDPISVHDVISDFERGVNLVLTQSRTVPQTLQLYSWHRLTVEYVLE